ncbi:hypothetical protein SEA_LITTLEFELLA_52 [Gordonia phage LittleFella]|nr:hypothetical protein SEA_LITTLEFELLA_52 [Gordonia phage LittleFella]
MTEDRIQRRISSLLSLAAHPGTPEVERARAQAQADELMAKYNVEQALLNWEKPIEARRKPIVMEYDPINLVNMAFIQSERDYSEYQVNGTVAGIRSNVFRFAGTRATSVWKREEKRTAYTVVGYEEDVYYGEALWNMVFQEILRSMFPGWSEDRSMDDNIYLLKNAGYSWPQIREIGIANKATDAQGPLTAKNAASKLRTAYGRAAKARGEDPKPPRILNPHWWRVSYVDSFSVRIQQRFAALKAGREEWVGTQNLPAMQAQKDAVDEAFYEMFPDLRPPTEEEMAKLRAEAEERKKNEKAVRPKKQKTRYYDDSAWAAGHAAASRVKLTQDQQFERKQEISE